MPAAPLHVRDLLVEAVGQAQTVLHGTLWLPLPDFRNAQGGTSGLMKALADPTRLTMVASLWKADAPICICDFTAGLELTQRGHRRRRGARPGA